MSIKNSNTKRLKLEKPHLGALALALLSFRALALPLLSFGVLILAALAFRVLILATLAFRASAFRKSRLWKNSATSKIISLLRKPPIRAAKVKWTSIFLCFSLSACGDIKMEKQDSLNENGVKDVTNLSSCHGPAPSGISLFNTQWRADLLETSGTGDMTYRQIFKFEPGAISMALTCTKSTSQATVQVRARASVVGTQINVISQDTAEAFLNLNGELVSCKAEIQAGAKMQFQFVGPCLKLHDGATTQVLVPTVYIP